AIENAGYEVGRDVVFALDAATTELYDEAKKRGRSGYCFFKSNPDRFATTDEMIEFWAELCEKYPIRSIEDGLAEDDWDGWQKLTQRLGGRIQLVGDDLFVTNVQRLREGIAKGAANSILVKVNQIGTLTETLDAIELAKRHKMTTIISHRSGETEDVTIADIAVATNAGQIKTGSDSRTDRGAKENQLLPAEENPGDEAVRGAELLPFARGGPAMPTGLSNPPPALYLALAAAALFFGYCAWASGQRSRHPPRRPGDRRQNPRAAARVWGLLA